MMKKTYLSVDSPYSFDGNNNSHGDIHTSEFLNTINSLDLPTHELRLKIGIPIKMPINTYKNQVYVMVLDL